MGLLDCHPGELFRPANRGREWPFTTARVYASRDEHKTERDRFSCYRPAERPVANHPMKTAPARYLKELRERLGLGVRDVQQASGIIAGEEQNPEFYISASRLSQIENEDSVPSLHKLFSISAIYGVDFVQLLGRYGVNPDRIHRYKDELRLNSTHPVQLDIHSAETIATIPIRVDPSFRLDSTQLLNYIVAQWGTVPAVLLKEVSPRSETYGYIGLSDLTMHPLLRPGSFVLIDGSQRKVAHPGWDNEYERPIYFIELRTGYRCGWCQVQDHRLTIVSHPMSPVAAETFRYPDEAEIVGRVVGVAMRIAPMKTQTPKSERSLQEPPAFGK